MRCGLADGFADGWPSHAVLGRCDAICDGLSWHFYSTLRYEKMTAKLDLVSLQRCVFPRFYKNTLTRYKLLSLIRFEPATKSTGTNSYTCNKKKEGKLDLTSKNVTTIYAVTNLVGRTELLLANITNTTLATRADTGNIDVWRYKTTVGKCHSYQSGQLRGFRQKISPVSQLESQQYRPFKRKQTGYGKHRQTSLRLDRQICSVVFPAFINLLLYWHQDLTSQ